MELQSITASIVEDHRQEGIFANSQKNLNSGEAAEDSSVNESCRLGHGYFDATSEFRGFSESGKAKKIHAESKVISDMVMTKGMMTKTKRSIKSPTTADDLDSSNRSQMSLFDTDRSNDKKSNKFGSSLAYIDQTYNCKNESKSVHVKIPTSISMTRISPPSPPVAVTPVVPRDGTIKLSHSFPSLHSSSGSSSSRMKINTDSINQPFPKKLTLSSSFRPETALRLTNAPLNQSIRKDYDFESGRVLGHGASSTVRLAEERKTGRQVAIKSIPKFELLRRRSSCAGISEKRIARLQEWEVFSYLQSTSTNHKSIVQFINVYETDTKVHLVMEYCAGGELFDAIQRRRVGVAASISNVKIRQGASSSELALSPTSLGKKRPRPTVSNIAETSITSYTEAQAAEIGHQILSALAHLHEKNIVHRDVKPENILLVSEDDGDLRVKLSDFGTARVLHTTPTSLSSSISLPRSISKHSLDFQNEEGPVNTCLKSSNTNTAPSTPTTPTTPPNLRRLRAYSRVGSDYYSAPEVSLGQGYDTAVDVYSLGVTLFILLSGVPPTNTSTTPRLRCGSVVLDEDEDECFNSSSSSVCSSSSEENNTIDKDPNLPLHDNAYALNNTIEFPSHQWRDISSSAKNLLKRMLHPVPQCRISAKEALEHEWIMKHALLKQKADANLMEVGSCKLCSLNVKYPYQGMLSLDLLRNQKGSNIYTPDSDSIPKRKKRKKRREKACLSSSSITSSNLIGTGNLSESLSSLVPLLECSIPTSLDPANSQKNTSISESLDRLPPPKHLCPTVSFVELYNRVSCIAADLLEDRAVGTTSENNIDNVDSTACVGKGHEAHSTTTTAGTNSPGCNSTCSIPLVHT